MENIICLCHSVELFQHARATSEIPCSQSSVSGSLIPRLFLNRPGNETSCLVWVALEMVILVHRDPCTNECAFIASNPGFAFCLSPKLWGNIWIGFEADAFTNNNCMVDLVSFPGSLPTKEGESLVHFIVFDVTGRHDLITSGWTRLSTHFTTGGVDTAEHPCKFKHKHSQHFCWTTFLLL